jgi:peptidoglycan-N-acetylglucosamine deacetylase
MGAGPQLFFSDGAYRRIMTSLNRRRLLRAMAIGAVATVGGTPQAQARPLRAPVPATGMIAPPGVLVALPPGGNQLALTVDDGIDAEVVAAFATLCRDHGIRLTFFVNGANSSWTTNAPLIRPMVESGQLQLGNHTWSHPFLSKISPGAVADQISRNAAFLRNTYGVDGTPYFRPPYGVHTPATDRIAADQGYTTITLWSGTIGDSRRITADQMVGYAQQSFTAQQIVLMHANLPPVTTRFPELLGIIASRNLQTVTLDDVFS